MSVVNFPGAPRPIPEDDELPPCDVLAEAAKHNLARVLVIAELADGGTLYASSTGDAGALLLDLKLFERELLRQVAGDAE